MRKGMHFFLAEILFFCYALMWYNLHYIDSKEVLFYVGR
jgi:hypothetical protein